MWDCDSKLLESQKFISTQLTKPNMLNNSTTDLLKVSAWRRSNLEAIMLHKETLIIGSIHHLFILRTYISPLRKLLRSTSSPATTTEKRLERLVELWQQWTTSKAWSSSGRSRMSPQRKSMALHDSQMSPRNQYTYLMKESVAIKL